MYFFYHFDKIHTLCFSIVYFTATCLFRSFTRLYLEPKTTFSECIVCVADNLNVLSRFHVRYDDTQNVSKRCTQNPKSRNRKLYLWIKLYKTWTQSINWSLHHDYLKSVSQVNNLTFHGKIIHVGHTVWFIWLALFSARGRRFVNRENKQLPVKYFVVIARLWPFCDSALTELVVELKFYHV